MSHAKTLIKIKLPVQWKNTKIIIDKLRSLLLQLNSFEILCFLYIAQKVDIEKIVAYLFVVEKFLQWKDGGFEKKLVYKKKKFNENITTEYDQWINDKTLIIFFLLENLVDNPKKKMNRVVVNAFGMWTRSVAYLLNIILVLILPWRYFFFLKFEWWCFYIPSTFHFTPIRYPTYTHTH